jgi:hypothetical protein
MLLSPIACASHIIDDDCRITGNVPAKIARDRARIGVEPAAGGEANDDADCFAFVEALLRSGGLRAGGCSAEEEKQYQ